MAKRLIDVDVFVETLIEIDPLLRDMSMKMIVNALDVTPKVDAVPIEFIRSEIKNSKGFYNSSLRRLLDAWAERKDNGESN